MLAIATLATCGSAWALKSDRQAKIDVKADRQVATLGGNGQVTLIGHVKITQGSMAILGDKAIGYENQQGEWDHAIVTGSPAKFQQQLDNGSMVNGSADTIEYLVAENTIVLTGHATVVQQGRGEFHGAKLTYNTDSGQMVGEGGIGGQVHMTFQPKAAPAKPAPATAPPASSSVPSAPVSAPPAPASTAGSH
ncbi:MAG: hypothetical protein OJF55_003005 [Rhodanobacteraceae bacterium]|nr:MAG: hypothetical protein OJF55_003005 [Rhodanobacteraceae bacterium]